jgi:nucleotide-binding universal stress UspA family protein
MEKYEKILVPLDGSECAENILSTVEKLATDLKVSIALLRVAYAHTFPGVDPTEAEDKVVREAEGRGISTRNRKAASSQRIQSGKPCSIRR